MKSIEMSGKTVDMAVQTALKELNVSREQVEVEILETSGKKFLGIFGDKPAKVRVTVVREAAKPKPVIENKIEKPKQQTEEKCPVVAKKVCDTNEHKPEKTDRRPERHKPAKGERNHAPVAKTEKADRVFVVDEVAINAAKTFLENVFVNMDLKVLMEKRISAEGVVTFNLHGEDLGVLIGKHGQTLDSIQYLSNLVANKNTKERVKINIDIENYRQRRVETLTVLAKKIASQVKRTQQKVTLEPMTPHERKIIHMALQDDRRIKTNSEGEEPHRYVVIELK